MKIASPRFGELDVDEKDLIRFERGLPGFPECTEFVVLDHDTETPLRWLQNIERPEVAFLVVEPEQLLSSYSVDVPESVLKLVGYDEEDEPRDIGLFVILNAGSDGLTANLRAPVVVHVKRRRAHQLILDDPRLSLRHPIQPDPE